MKWKKIPKTFLYKVFFSMTQTNYIEEGLGDFLSFHFISFCLFFLVYLLLKENSSKQNKMPNYFKLVFVVFCLRYKHFLFFILGRTKKLHKKLFLCKLTKKKAFDIQKQRKPKTKKNYNVKLWPLIRPTDSSPK